MVYHLKEHPDLIAAFIKNGWVQGDDAMMIFKTAQTLKSGRNNYEDLISEYIPIVATIDLPEARKLVDELGSAGALRTLMRSYGKLSGLNAPWLDLDGIVARTWARIQKEKIAGGIVYVPIATHHGHVDALVILAQKLNSPRIPNDRADRAMRTEFSPVLLGVMPSEVLNEAQAVKFVLDNRDKLIFDAQTKKYKIVP
jgi:hypothetical protein